MEIGTKDGRSAFRDYLRCGWDGKHDPWGSGITALGGVADVLALYEVQIPSEWGYQPGVFGPDVTMDPTRDYLLMVRAGELDTEDLLYWGRVLDRYCDMADAAGHRY